LTALQKRKRYDYFVQDVSTAHTADYWVNVLNEMLEDRLMSHRFWAAR
jgi:hypothetical protein